MRTYVALWSNFFNLCMNRSTIFLIQFVSYLIFYRYNIYIRHQETSAIRDIFLAPFNPKLIACVVCVALIASITIFIISNMTLHDGCRRISCTDAVIWSMGILCQQGI